MNVQFSVIIPVYKAEKTLRRCLDSLLAQDCDHAELILINDGSPDESGRICEEYQERYSAVQYYSKRNGGVSSARNIGLDMARGEYILFVDSDDFVAADYFSTLDALTAKWNTDWIQFSKTIYDGSRYINQAYSETGLLSSSEYESTVCDAICRKRINSPCTKVYRRSIIDDGKLRFDEQISNGEDKLFNIQYALLAKTCCISDRCLYIVSTENSASLSRNTAVDYSTQFEYLEGRIYHTIENAQISDDFKHSLRKAYNFSVCRSIYHDAKSLYSRGIPFRRRWKILHRMCSRINRTKKEYPSSRYCRIIVFPVKHRLCVLIDILACCLVKGILGSH